MEILQKGIQPRALWNLLLIIVVGVNTLMAAAPGEVSFGMDVSISGRDPDRVSQNETAIAANPVNPETLVAVFQGKLTASDRRSCFFSFTNNAGRTWQVGGKAPLQGARDLCIDPAIAVDHQGNFYFSYIDARVPGSFVTELDVLVAKSTDGGRTFPSFSVAVDNISGKVHSPNPDKDFIGVDTNIGSPFRGTVYLAFTDQSDQRGQQIAVVISRDGGTTWSAPQIIGAVHGNQDGHLRTGALPVVGPDGSVYTFWAEYMLRTGPISIRYSKSPDGGQTWNEPVSVVDNVPGPGLAVIKNADPGFGIEPEVGLLLFTLPSAAVAPNGTLYVAWSDFSEGSCVDTGSDLPACTNSDVKLSVSGNGGLSWSSPIKVSDDTNATDQFFPWIASHPDGRMSLVWLDRRLDPNNVNYDVFYTSTFDGASLQPNIRVSSATSLLGTQSFIGDYIGLAGTATGVFPVWCDSRFGNPDIFGAPGRLP